MALALDNPQILRRHKTQKSTHITDAYIGFVADVMDYSYINKVMSFYINHFSSIIFHYLVR